MKNARALAVSLVTSAVLLASSAAFAAPPARREAPPKPRATTPAPSRNVAPPVDDWSYRQTSTKKAPRIYAAAPFMLVGSTATFGAFGGVEFHLVPTLPELELGGETGFFIGSNGAGTTWMIPIQASGFYHFKLAGLNDIHPFGGLGLGMAIVSSTVPGINLGILGTTAGSTATSAEFMWQLHLGAAFGADKKFFGDIRIGTIGSNFAFAPTVGYNF
jgi:hypothetical protein